MIRTSIVNPSVIVVVAIVSLFVSVTAVAQQAPKGMNRFIDGMEAYEAGDYDAALSSFDGAIEEDSSNLQFQYYYALTYKALGKTMEAVSILTAILSADPKTYHSAYFDLAAIYSEQKEYDAALKCLNDAEWAVPGNSRVYMEKGYVRMKMKNYPAAVGNFNRAVELDPGLAQQVFYNIGAAWLESGNTDKAIGMFTKAIKEDPDSDIAGYAREGINHAGVMRRAAKPWHLFAMLGYAYDDNIPNDPLDRPGVGAPPKDLGDQYQTLTINGYYTIVKHKKIGFDAGYLVSYLHYNDSDNENSFGNSPYLLVKYMAGPWYMDVKYSFAYYLADGDSKQVQHAVMPTVSLSEPHGMQTLLTLLWQDRDYKDDGLTPDTVHTMVNIVQMFSIPGTTVRPAMGFKYGDEDADADTSSYSYMEFMLGASFEIPFKVHGNISYTGTSSEYDSPDNREDEGYIVSAMFSRAVTDILTARLTYSHVNNDSNQMTSGYDPYEYEKNIVIVLAEINI